MSIKNTQEMLSHADFIEQYKSKGIKTFIPAKGIQHLKRLGYCKDVLSHIYRADTVWVWIRWAIVSLSLYFSISHHYGWIFLGIVIHQVIATRCYMVLEKLITETAIIDENNYNYLLDSDFLEITRN